MTKPIGGSGAARIAADAVSRFRGIVEVLQYDLQHNQPDITTERRTEVMERIDRYTSAARDIEVELVKFRAVPA